MDKLSDVLDERQKKNKVHNLLNSLSRKGRIRNEGTRGEPRWVALRIKES